jgi:carbon-monoxide dehydrogenase iron sulfur subunit
MPKTKKQIVIHEEYCIGCRLCEIHCLVAHSQSKKILKALKEEFNLKDATPRIVVEQEGHVSFGMPCRHCEDAVCIESCMTGALHRDPKTGAVLWDGDRCVGCYMCIMSCPYGVIKRDKANKKIASKCDLCVETGSDIPVCVKNCPNEALTLEDLPESEGCH